MNKMKVVAITLQLASIPLLSGSFFVKKDSTKKNASMERAGSVFSWIRDPVNIYRPY